MIRGQKRTQKDPISDHLKDLFEPDRMPGDFYRSSEEDLAPETAQF